jgi:hypothetical protein
MKKALILVGCLAIAAIAHLADVGGLQEKFGLVSPRGDDVFASAFSEHRENFVAEGRGTVTRVLSDDNDGSRHQRFIVTLASGQTLLISHNIDLAPRVQGLVVGDSVNFKGEYEWNDKGGVLHWTHHDPEGRHETGWISHGGKTYQ